MAAWLCVSTGPSISAVREAAKRYSSLSIEALDEYGSRKSNGDETSERASEVVEVMAVR